MLTDDLYSRDAYLRSTEATVVQVRPEGLVLDRTVFYARGGGQPGDTGTLAWGSGECRVIDTFKSDGEIVHALDPAATPPEAGASVTATIDWERRHRMMRTHTALHSLSGIVFTDYGAKVTGGNMADDGSARMDFQLEQVAPELGKEETAKVNARLAEDVQVHVSFL